MPLPLDYSGGKENPRLSRQHRIVLGLERRDWTKAELKLQEIWMRENNATTPWPWLPGGEFRDNG